MLGEPSRLDKWLWSLRAYKTRSEAADACERGRILVNGAAAKPSRELKVGDIVCVRKSPVAYTYKVVDIPPSRVGASLVSKYVENLTPTEELEKLSVNSAVIFAQRDRGTGRPTKKDRRDIGKLLENGMDSM
ncbi:MAG: RNA-binding S4 domain-containing protein [Prevotellaceae bacterium]|jgi:ribosome-associated heat shock protein Hsp15|nr:RNA-binding S4 domain-containing protein [Prevotellaceae bacterium]